MNDCRGNPLWLPWGWAAPRGLLAAVNAKNLYSRALYLWLLIGLSSLMVSREGIKFSGSVGFRNGSASVHTSRTMMLAELTAPDSRAWNVAALTA